MTHRFARRLGQIEIPNFDPKVQVRNHFKGWLYDAVKLSGRERKNICDDMHGLDMGLFSKWMNPNESDCMSAHWLVLFTRAAGPYLLAQIAHEAGFELVYQGDEALPGLPSGDLLPLLSKLHGDAMAAMIQARSDGVISESEKRAIYPGLKRCISVLEAEAEHYRPESMRRSA